MPESQPPSDVPEPTVVTRTVRRVERPIEADPREACLVVIYGTGLGRRVALGTAPIEAGRSSRCEIPIEHESVSRRHARFEWTGAGWRVVDLGSTNGTFVNDEMVKSRELKDRDQVKIGRTILKFMTGDNVEASYHEEIYRLMTFDGLTQVHNRRYFEEALEREVARSLRYERELSLILFDVDHFKKKNDQFGHLAGDAVLRELAAVVKPKLRREDVLARVGGEEFAVLAPEVGLAGAREAAEKVRKIVEITPFRYEASDIPTTISLGTAELQASDTPADLYRRADEALYTAKESGRNKVA